MKTYVNGLGETVGGDVLASQTPVLTSGNIWWVNSATGSDAAGTAGQDRERPLATIGQANTNASDGDVIVLQSGHTETLSSALSLKAVLLVGIGTSSGKPAAQLKIDNAGASCVQFAATAGEIRNVYFPASVQSNTSGNGKVRFTCTGMATISGCYFESSANDQLPALSIDSSPAYVENCTFVSTATSIATRPTRGVYISGAIADLRLVGNTFDSGTVGFSSVALDLSAGTITRLRAHSNSFLRGADASIASASVGYFVPSTTSGAVKVTW